MAKTPRTPPKKQKKQKGTIVVVLLKKSPWQKDDCLFCREKSTKEACATIVGDRHFLANMRCCKSAKCQSEASKLAKKCCEDRIKRS